MASVIPSPTFPLSGCWTTAPGPAGRGPWLSHGPRLPSAIKAASSWSPPPEKRWRKWHSMSARAQHAAEAAHLRDRCLHSEPSCAMPSRPCSPSVPRSLPQRTSFQEKSLRCAGCHESCGLHGAFDLGLHWDRATAGKEVRV